MTQTKAASTQVWEDAVLVEDAIVALEGKLTSELQDTSIAVAGDFTERTEVAGWCRSFARWCGCAALKASARNWKFSRSTDAEVAEDTEVEATEARALNRAALRSARN